MTRNALRLGLAGICTALAFTGCSFSVGDMKPIGGTPSPPAPPATTAPDTPESSPSAPETDPTDSPSPSDSGTGQKVPRASVEVAIMNKVNEKSTKTVVVDCPGDLDATVGTTMTCDWNTIEQKGQVEIRVTSIDPDGKVNFSFRDK